MENFQSFLDQAIENESVLDFLNTEPNKFFDWKNTIFVLYSYALFESISFKNGD